MLRKQIKNGILTADVLEVLKKVATNSEWAALRNLEVVTAVAYLNKDRKATVKDWCESVLADQGRLTARKDDRTRAWYGVPLERFVGKLADERKQMKARGKNLTLPDDERARAAGLDGLLKLLVNTVYGVLASRYFTIGNTVLGNNITARARCGVWMVAKALGLRQCITDGGIYCPEKVCTFKTKKPGLDTLSRPWGWQDRKNGYRSHCAMGGLDWSVSWDNRDIDQVAMEHVRQFWNPYGLVLPFNLEHKKDHTFNRAAYWSKGDYALQTAKGIVYAVRGKDKNKRSDRKHHPTFALLDSIIAGADSFPADLNYTKGGIMKVGKFLIVQNCNGFENLKVLRPGDSLPDEEHAARYNNVHFPLMDESDYLKRRNRKKVHRRQSVQWFERRGDHGIAAVHEAMKRNALRG
jgi:hypothetical protein